MHLKKFCAHFVLLSTLGCFGELSAHIGGASTHTKDVPYEDSTARDEYLRPIYKRLTEISVAITRNNQMIQSSRDEHQKLDYSRALLLAESFEILKPSDDYFIKYLVLTYKIKELKKNIESNSSMKALVTSAKMSVIDNDLKAYIDEYLKSDKAKRHSMAEKLNTLISSETDSTKQAQYIALQKSIKKSSSEKDLEATLKLLRDLRSSEVYKESILKNIESIIELQQNAREKRLVEAELELKELLDKHGTQINKVIEIRSKVDVLSAQIKGHEQNIESLSKVNKDNLEPEEAALKAKIPGAPLPETKYRKETLRLDPY